MATSDEENHALRFFDLIKGTKRLLPPIKGYETVPLMSLEEAIEPLIPIVFDIRRMVWIVKENCQNPADHLSSDESASIMLYSLEWMPREKSFYMVLNHTLRTEDRHALKPWFRYLKLFITALNKLPIEHRPLYRGIKEDLHTNYKRGETFIWWGFTSCTCSLEILENELYLGKTGQRTLFHIKSLSGKNIRQHSMFKKEDEVILLVARQFQVESCLDAGNGLHIIEIVEIEPLYPLLEPLLPSFKSNFVSVTNLVLPRNENLERIIDKCSGTTGRIDMSGQVLNEQDMQILIQRAVKGKRCKVLDLIQSEITSDAISILANGLRDNQSLENLNLSHSNINDADVRCLTSQIYNSALKYLDLTGNEISDSGAHDLADFLIKNTNLLRLSLAQNQIGDQGVEKLAGALTTDQTHLEVLNLSGNMPLTDQSIDALIKMLEENRSLKKLDLRHCNIMTTGQTKLQIAIKLRKGFELWMSREIC